MPRTRVQQDQHNERRRRIKKEGRKAIFCMHYILSTYPEIHSKACEFFTTLNQRYPGKRDLTKTYEFNQLKDQQGLVKNTTMLEPRLKIPLIPNNAVSAPTNDPTTTEEEIPLFVEMESEEIERIIKELRQDPNLASAFDKFDNIELEDVSAYTTIETTTVEEIPPLIDTESQEIAKIVEEISEDPDLSSVFNDVEFQLEFDHLGEDLPELDQEIIW